MTTPKELGHADADLDRCARELNTPRAPHNPGCGRLVSLADELRFYCPHCNRHMHQGLAPHVTPERALEMLMELGARRDQLGLPTSTGA